MSHCAALRIQRDYMGSLLKVRGFKRRLRWFALRGREYRKNSEVVILSVVNGENVWSHSGNGFAYGTGDVSLMERLRTK